MINFTKTEITTTDLHETNTYLVIDYTPNGYKQLWSYIQEDFFCGTYFVLKFPFSKSFNNPVDYFNSNSDEEITYSIDCFENKTYCHADFTHVKINQIIDSPMFTSLTSNEDLNTIYYFAKYGFTPLFYPCVFSGHSKLQQKSLLINGTLEERAVALHKMYGIGVSDVLGNLKNMKIETGLLPPSCILKNITNEMVCQYLELNIPFCHPNMYPFLKLETNTLIVDGQIKHIETVDEFMSIWVGLKLKSLIPDIEKEKAEMENQQFIYQFLLSITDSTHFVWFVWATPDERKEWISDNITSRAIGIINGIKLGDIAMIAERVLRHEGVVKEIDNKRDYRGHTAKDYFINKLKQ
jgi:hypothetical protein